MFSQLQSVSGSLPSPLNSVATALASQLQSAGSIFGGLASVGNPPSTTTVTNAITVLQALPILSPGQIIPAGALSSVATLLTTIASEPGVPAPVASTLDSVATTLSGNVDSTALSGAITQLQGVSSQLPSPLNDVVGGIITQLAQAGSLSGTTTTSTTSTSTTSTNTTTTSTTDTTSTTSTTSNSTSSGAGGGGGGSSGGAGGSHSGTHGGSIVVLGGQRRGDSLSLLLYCSASANRSCTATVTLTERSRRTIRRRVTMRGGRQRAITLHLRPLRRHHPRLHRQPMRLSLRSGAYKLNVRLR